ncbi:hypothetical protein FH972_027028 [Carpinus fangiana]|uniref:Uncharacterized protein n=1 Tax=Carpinus fangiana TaxID=176857 RepID=A0A5N6L5R8_9ROSI|nr:hypothetical protein FH972_027028 [Carpinus fangiana]
MDSYGVQFAIARIIECYATVSDRSSLESWLLELQTLRAKHAGTVYSGTLTTAGNEINAFHALARFDEGDFQAAWACLDLTPKSSNELALDPKLALQRSEQMLLQARLFQNEGKVDKVPFSSENSLMLGQQRGEVCETSTTPEFHSKSSMRFRPLHLVGTFRLTVPWKLLLTSKEALLLMTHILQADPKVRLQMADQVVHLPKIMP